MRNSRLERAASRVLNAKGTQLGIEIIFVTPSGNVSGRKVIEHHSSADFVTRFTTDYELTTMVALVDYRYKIYPHRDNLKAIVQFFPLDVSADKYLSSTPLFSDTYRALLFDNDDGANAAGSSITAGKETTSLDEERMIKIQLVETASEALSYKAAQATFRMTDNFNIVTGFLGEMIRQEALVNPDAKVGVQMEPIDSVVEVREAVTIPPTVRLVDVPEFMQTKQGGLYSQGLGSFIQGKMWWIYPMFDTTRFQKTTRRLNIIQLKGAHAPISEKSWLAENGEITIVCTTACKMQDISVSAGINQGQGTRFLKASSLFDSPVDGDPNKESFNREENVAEFQVGSREDGNNIAMFSDNTITDNIANEYSKIAFRKGQLFMTIWQRSLARLLYPGMPLRLYYDKDGTTEVYDGCLMQVDEQWSSEVKGMIQKNMIATSALVCFINKEATSNG